VLLDVEGATTWANVSPVPLDAFRHVHCPPIQCQNFGGHVPQRLQSVCVLLWRFPKLEVPFAVSRSVSKCGWRVRTGARRTHFGLGTKSETKLVN
jgi:hypothetical protein